MSTDLNHRYHIMEELGEGAMGVVYRGYDRLRSSEVAIKQAHPAEQPANPEQVETLQVLLASEFRILATMNHPNIVKVRDYGFTSAGNPYFVMDLLENCVPVTEFGRDKGLTIQVELLSQILQALIYLHRRGILHRDLKPTNIMVTPEGLVKVLDFGLAAHLSQLKEEEGMVGTLAYMSPEVVKGLTPDAHADLYAVGIIAYEMLTGSLPFADLALSQMIMALLNKPVEWDAVPIPADLKDVLFRLTLKNPDDRFGDAVAVLDALKATQGQDSHWETPELRESLLQAARFVGRDSEMGILQNALRDAIDHRGGMVFISGESGSGKSRIVEEITSQVVVQGALVFKGQATQTEQTPYNIWQPILREFALLFETPADDMAWLLHIVPGLETLLDRPIIPAAIKEPEMVPSKLKQVIMQMLKSTSQPLCIFLEDLHWMSSESLDLLQHISTGIADLPVLVVATYRSDEMPHLPDAFDTAQVIPLQRLNEEALRELITSMTSQATDALLEFILTETEGNIYFVVEVIRSLVEQSGRTDTVSAIPLPRHVFTEGMASVMQHRINRVPAQLQQTLQLAALAGRVLDTELLNATGKTPVDIESFVMACSDAAVLEFKDEHWQFAHDKLREAVERTVDVVEQTAMHRELANTLLKIRGHFLAAQVSRLAYHYQRSDDHESAYTYTVMLGEQHVNIGRFDEALNTFELAMNYVDEADHMRLGEIQSWIGRVHQYQKDDQQAEVHYSQSLAHYNETQNVSGTASVYEQLGIIAAKQEDWTKARQHFEQSRQLFESLAAWRELARVVNELANCHMQLGDEAGALALYNEALSIGRKRR